VLPFGKPITMGDVLDGLRSAAPITTTGETSNPAPPTVALPDAGNLAQALPPTPPALEPEIDDPARNESFCRIAASAATTVVVFVAQDAIRKSGYEPNDPDDEDVEDVNEHTAAALARAIGDREIPWWMPIIVGYANLCAGMRIGAKKLEKDTTITRAPTLPPPVPADTPSTPPPAPSPTVQRASGTQPTGAREPIRRVA
jgi:hypothetical protein